MYTVRCIAHSFYNRVFAAGGRYHLFQNFSIQFAPHIDSYYFAASEIYAQIQPLSD